VLRIVAVDRPKISPLEMPDRFRMEIVYFMTPGDHPDAPTLAECEYWVRSTDARRWLDEGVVSIVSPLAAEVTADIELTEYHERWLEWLIEHGVEHMRLERGD
jgi:hypothetical protein